MDDPNRRIEFDFNSMMARTVGEEHGIRPDEVEAHSGRIAEAVQDMAKERASGALPFMDLPYQQESVDTMRQALKDVPGDVDDLVVLGIGGSALGLVALHTALSHPYHNLCQTPRLHVVDNVDPDQFSALLDVIDLDRAVFNVITKSGSTAETMAQFLIVHEALRKRGGDWKQRLLLTTDPEKGILRPIADEGGFLSFQVPPGVGGRFSVLSPVGLVPAMLLGMDVDGLLSGAAAMDARCQTPDVRANPAAMGALLQYLLDTTRGKTMAVMMAYALALRDVADWYRQLWAESLGKIRKTDGREEFVGPTPIKALGATDQHSQVQLYREGPNDKIFTLLAVENFGRDVDIPAAPGEDEGVSYLGDHTMGRLMNAERRATVYALNMSQRPNVTVTLPAVNAHTVGQLLYMLEVQTSFAGELLGLGMDTYLQHGVEAVKQATFALMGRQGYEDLRTEIERHKPDPDCII